ncbi:MAG: hypothetical protein AB8C95_13700 [Phycisphaeraceae bacterium]
MSRFNSLVAVLALTPCIGCDESSPQSLDDATIEVAIPAATSKGYANLNRAVATALDEDWESALPIDETTEYYRSLKDPWDFQDLNGDGIDEALCSPSAISSDGEIYSILGATGNGPHFIFRNIDNYWQLIADVSGRFYDVDETFINGWPVIISSFKHSNSNFPTKVQVFENGKYRLVHEYRWYPRED